MGRTATDCHGISQCLESGHPVKIAYRSVHAMLLFAMLMHNVCIHYFSMYCDVFLQTLNEAINEYSRARHSLLRSYTALVNSIAVSNTSLSSHTYHT